VDPVPNPLLLRQSGSSGNQTRASEYGADNSVIYGYGRILPASAGPEGVNGNVANHAP
jgi:hypothetical protein